jgi:hypothetical protein
LNADQKKVFAHRMEVYAAALTYADHQLVASSMRSKVSAIAEGRFDNTIPFRISLDETLDIGEDTGTPVSNDYTVPFQFTGTLNRVIVGTGESKLTAEDEEQIRF